MKDEIEEIEKIEMRTHVLTMFYLGDPADEANQLVQSYKFEPAYFGSGRTRCQAKSKQNLRHRWAEPLSTS